MRARLTSTPEELADLEAQLARPNDPGLEEDDPRHTYPDLIPQLGQAGRAHRDGFISDDEWQEIRGRLLDELERFMVTVPGVTQSGGQAHGFAPLLMTGTDGRQLLVPFLIRPTIVADETSLALLRAAQLLSRDDPQSLERLHAAIASVRRGDARWFL